jgi:hypothetical protein
MDDGQHRTGSSICGGRVLEARLVVSGLIAVGKKWFVCKFYLDYIYMPIFLKFVCKKDIESLPKENLWVCFDKISGSGVAQELWVITGAAKICILNP